MREIALDTETTGLDPAFGHRIVEIGCVEMTQRIRTGKAFHSYLNPERAVPREAEKIHGLGDAFLADKPVFAQVVETFLAFLGEDRLVIHNAGFDLKFLNHELTRLGFAAIPVARVTDTLALCRQKFPGAPNSLDALCRRFAIDLSERHYHGALLDAELLAEVYLELHGGRQAGLNFAAPAAAAALPTTAPPREIPTRAFPASPEEKARHRAFLKSLASPLWETLEEA